MGEGRRDIEASISSQPRTGKKKSRTSSLRGECQGKKRGLKEKKGEKPGLEIISSDRKRKRKIREGEGGKMGRTTSNHWIKTFEEEGREEMSRRTEKKRGRFNWRHFFKKSSFRRREGGKKKKLGDGSSIQERSSHFKRRWREKEIGASC